LAVLDRVDVGHAQGDLRAAQLAAAEAVRTISARMSAWWARPWIRTLPPRR
jgi:hypothetical protein